MTDPVTLDTPHELLMRAAIVISSFRNRLKKAGYPFPEPSDAQRIISDIDAVMEPLLASADNKTQYQIPQFVPSR